MKTLTVKQVLWVGLALCILAVIGTITCARAYNAGKNHGQKLVSLEAFEAARASLQSRSLTPQTREYIKAQFYYYGCQIKPQIIRRTPVVDYGRVDDALLGGIEPFIPHADSPNDYYRQIQCIHDGK
jgi:hypothetical protein